MHLWLKIQLIEVFPTTFVLNQQRSGFDIALISLAELCFNVPFGDRFEEKFGEKQNKKNEKMKKKKKSETKKAQKRNN